jgi:hypothetical protein
MKPECLLRCSQEPTTGLSPEPLESSTHSHTISTVPFRTMAPFTAALSRRLFPSGFPTKNHPNNIQRVAQSV